FWLSLRWAYEPAWHRPIVPALAGLLAGLSVLAHPMTLPVPAVCLLLLVVEARGWGRVRAGASYAATFLITVLPWPVFALAHQDLFELPFLATARTVGPMPGELWERALQEFSERYHFGLRAYPFWVLLLVVTGPLAVYRAVRFRGPFAWVVTAWAAQTLFL